MNTDLNPTTLLQYRRKINGISAILLPFQANGQIDWAGFRAHVARTANAGIVPAINMDTGFGNLLSNDERLKALDETKSVLGGQPFVAGAFVGDQPGAKFDYETYSRRGQDIISRGGLPVIFQSFGLTQQSDEQIISAYTKLGQALGSFIGFELGTMFAPFGKIYSLDVFRGLLGIRECIGAKHSSLKRDQEWQRLIIRNQTRPDFKLYTGNDLAIDMVMYGSDYLLGLSTFAPDLFARRDEYWRLGDARFYELNDRLQYLGFFAFRNPVPAYKHSAAQFLKLRGWIGCDHTHPKSATRPDSDVAILKELLEGF